MGGESFCEEIVCELTCLLQSINSIINFKVYPSVVFVVSEIVFIDEFLWDVRDFDAYVFWAVERCAEEEVGDVKACKSGIRR